MKLTMRLKLVTCAFAVAAILATGMADDPSVAGLSSTRPETIVQAIRLLKTNPFPTLATPILLKLLESPDESVQLAAMEFWGNHASEAYEDMYFVSLAGEPGFIELKTALPEVLERLAKSRNERIRRAAVRTFCAASAKAESICPPRRGCGNIDTIDQALENELFEHGKEWAAVIESLIDDPNPNVVLSALEVGRYRDVPNTKTPSVQAKVAKMLRNDSKYFRAIGAAFIEPASQSEAIRVLDPLLSDTDPDVAESAYWFAADKIKLKTLVERLPSLSAKLRALLAFECTYHSSDPSLDSTKCESLVRTLLSDEDPEVRSKAIDAAGALRLEFSKEQLRAFLGSNVGTIRVAGLSGLLEKKVADSKELAARSCSDPDVDVRKVAVGFAVNAKDPALDPAIMKAIELGLEDDAYLVAPFLERPGNGEYLDQVIHSGQPKVRLIAVMSMYGDRHIDRLLPMSLDKDPDVLEAVVKALGEYQTQDAVDALESIAERVNGELLGSVLENIGFTKQVGATSFLRRYVKNPDRNVRRTARWAIDSLAEFAVRP